jgi:hypothetical protein
VSDDLIPSPDKKLLEDLQAPPLRVPGFKKKGGDWLRNVESVYQGVNLKTSQWSKSFYINLDTYFTQFGFPNPPVWYKFHVRERLESLVHDSYRLDCLLDLDQRTPDKKEQQEIVQLLMQHGIPWLDQMSTLDGLRKALRGSRHLLWVLPELRRYLGPEFQS